MLLISEIVIIRQVEQPIRYRPPQANLVTIRAKASRLTLFNKKTTDYEKITLNLQPSNSFTCKRRKMGGNQTDSSHYQSTRHLRKGEQINADK